MLIDTIVDLSMDIEDSARRLGLWQQTISDVGVGLPGLVTRSGVLRAAPNLIDVVELDAKRILEDRLQRRVWVDNDATCAAVAEWREGAGANCDDFLLVTIGTGIGAGIIANGRLLRGINGFAGELGHMFVDPAGPPCPCGRSGCWERYASGSGLALLARTAVTSGNGDDFVHQAGSIEKIRGEDVGDLASRGSAQALGVLDEFGRWIAVGLSNMVNVLDPERIVLGGGAARMGDLLLQPVRSWLERLLYASDHRPTPDVVIARFGESAGAIGAGMLPLVH
jgi:glucokinase